MTSGFKVICNDCGNNVEVKDDTINNDYKDNGFTFYNVQSDGISILCKCRNEVSIFER